MLTQNVGLQTIEKIQLIACLLDPKDTPIAFALGCQLLLSQWLTRLR